MSILQAALLYCERGWRVLPCESLGKRPLTTHGVWDATHDQQMISRWWSCWPEANIGIATGTASELFVLDVDGDKGERSLDSLQERNAVLPETLQARTPRGGRHLFLLHPGQQVGNRVSVLGGLDIRADHGYVVAAPSRLRSGEYQWLNDPLNTPIAPAPGWLLEFIQPKRSTPQSESRAVRSPRAYALEVLAEETIRVARAQVGQRNNTLNGAAFAVGRFVASGVLDQATVVRLLRRAALAAGLERSEVEATLRSGLFAGEARAAGLQVGCSDFARRRLLWALPLSSRAKVLLAVLDSHADSSGWCWPSQRRLLRECSFGSFSTLAAALQEIAPLVEVRPTSFGRGRRCHSYRLRWDLVEQRAASPNPPHNPKMESLSATAAVANSPSERCQREEVGSQQGGPR